MERKIYELILTDENLQGVDCISVVGEPAMESKYVAFANQEPKINFAKIDEEKQILLGVAMIPEKNIFRFDEDTKEEYYVYFTKETIKRVSELYLKKGNQLNANLEHDSKNTINATIVESWIVEDTEKDKTKLYNIDAPVGSWVVAMKIESKEDWQKAKEQGTRFSIEGMFTERVNFKKEDMNFNLKEEFDKLKEDIKQMFSKGNVKLGTNEIVDAEGNVTGKIEFEGEMLQAGSAVNLVTDEGVVPLPAGTYSLQTNITLVVSEDGIVGELVEEQQASTEQPTNEQMNGDILEAIRELVSLAKENQSEIVSLKSQLAEQNEKVVELSQQPAVAPIVTAPVEKEVKMATTAKGRILEVIEKHKN